MGLDTKLVARKKLINERRKSERMEGCTEVCPFVCFLVVHVWSLSLRIARLFKSYVCVVCYELVLSSMSLLCVVCTTVSQSSVGSSVQLLDHP